MAKLEKDRQRTTWMIEPPAELITPAVARKWLHRTYPGLAGMTALIAYPFAVRGLGSRRANELAVEGMRAIAGDIRTIATVCGTVLGTGHPITMRYDPGVQGYYSPHRVAVRKLRALRRFEEKYPHPYTRGILRRSIVLHESSSHGPTVFPASGS